MRIAARIAVEVLLTVIVTILLVGAANTIDSADPAGAFLREAPAMVFGVFWIALVLWVILVVVGNVAQRSKPPRARVIADLLSALVASVLNTAVFAVIGFSAGGFGLLLVAIAIVPGIAFLVAAAVVVPLTQLVLFRSQTPAAATSAGPAVPAA